MSAIDAKIIRIDGVSLVGIRLDADSESPDLYTLITYGANEIPLVVNDKLAFFSSPGYAGIAYEFFSESIKEKARPPLEVDSVCDVAGAMYLITRETADHSATVLNCLNFIFDLIAATPLQMPTEYEKILNSFADHLTFHQEFATYLEQDQIARDTIIDAIVWCIGAVALHSHLIDQSSNLGIALE